MITRKDNEMIWQNKLPTEPGWYWIKGPTSVEPYIGYVRLYCNELAIGNSPIKGWKRMEQSMWAGPIPEPDHD
jgi:hypothetical protein